jgi:phosphohistidine phosphatase
MNRCQLSIVNCQLGIMSQKADWWYYQSGVLPYRLGCGETSNSDIEILLITSRKRKHWVIPKGIVEPSMHPQESAIKEAFEEAGIKGNLAHTAIGVYAYQKWSGTCRVEVFPFEVTTELQEWPESEFRTREWMSLEEAVNRVREDALKGLLRKLPEYINRKDDNTQGKKM